jgi:hypothetical protein
MRKNSKQSISKIQRDLWKECRRIAYEQQKDKNGEIHCYTCQARNIQGSNRQLGHVPYPKSILGANLKYDMRVLKFQCYHCNINCGGMGAEALKRMTKEYGQEFMEKLEKDRNISVKAMDYYLELLERYKQM